MALVNHDSMYEKPVQNPYKGLELEPTYDYANQLQVFTTTRPHASEGNIGYLEVLETNKPARRDSNKSDKYNYIDPADLNEDYVAYQQIDQPTGSKEHSSEIY